MSKKKITITSFKADQEARLDHALSLTIKERWDLLELLRKKAYGKRYTEYKRPEPAVPVIVISTRTKKDGSV